LFVCYLFVICLVVYYLRMTIWCKTGALFMNFLRPAEPKNRTVCLVIAGRLKHFPPWSVEQQQVCFVARDQQIGDGQRFAAPSNRFAC
jgi:hypothetical protein